PGGITARGGEEGGPVRGQAPTGRGARGSARPGRERRARARGATRHGKPGRPADEQHGHPDPRARRRPPGVTGPGEALVRAVSLTRSFGDVRAVDGLDLSVARGELFGFLGPNGAGKT